MYIRVTSTPKSPRKSVKIVASVREGYKVRQVMIHNLGVASNDEQIEKLKCIGYEYIARFKLEQDKSSGQTNLFPENEQALVQSFKQIASKPGRKIKKTLENIIPLNQVTLDQIEEKARIVEGIHEVGGHMYELLGYNGLLSSKNDQRILKDLVLSRLAEPSSKHKACSILNKKFGKSHEISSIYRVMDRLHPSINALKTLTFENTKRLIPGTVDIVFFDVTTLYFESTTTDDLREFGYSKDHRFNTTQVVLALATNRDGLPIGYELFSGNTAETKTLIASIESWKRVFNIGSVCFVADRAMMSEDNVVLLEAHGYNYVIAAKLRSFDKKLKEDILDANHYVAYSIGQELAWIGEFSWKKKRLIVSYKSSRARNDEYKRNKSLEKIQKRLGEDGNAKKLINNSAALKYSKIDAAKAMLDSNKIATDCEWDGLHGLITNLSELGAREVLARYSRLWVIEESFRINKHNLEMRPIYHFKKERIESHIAICYMSFTLLKHLEYRIGLAGKLSPNEIREELMAVQSSIYAHKETGDKYRVPGLFTHNASKIYRALNIKRDLDASIYLE